MESLTSPSVSVKQTRRFSSSNSQKDLWFIARDGSIAELDSALLLLKKNGGNIDMRNAFGLSPLHIATWRNHVPMVKRLLAAGADPNARDGESGWSSLHRALHFGHLAVASVLLQHGASLLLEDSKYRTPVDLLSGPISQIIGSGLDSVATEVYSWGSGTNYQLGTGNAHVQKLPGKVDALHSSYVKIIVASKFHSVAVTASGELYTWGFGRGGRLGHPEFDIHSGQAAAITPRKVTFGLGSRRVRAVAAAKHHTVIAIENGDVFTWGSNREGQLGYTSVDTQPTPRRVTSLREKIVAVAAANKHTAAVAESGEVFTWGCNKEGQLGYGTSNSASNSTPRLVEYLKGKVLKGVSAAKNHTIVLGSDGEVFTWGHRLVTPRRVIIARSLKKCGNAPLKFHRTERLHVVSVAAGSVHSTVLTDDGALFYWVSADPDLRCQQLYSMCGRNVVGISAGKYWTAAVTTTGDVYMWDGKKCRADVPVATRLHGVKHATSVCAGETHLLVVSSLYHPSYPPKVTENHQKFRAVNDMLEEVNEDLMFDGLQVEVSLQAQQASQVSGSSGIVAPSLKYLCEKAAIDFLVEPRNAIHLLDIADTLEAHELRKHCEEIAIRNLDYIFTVSASAIMNAPLELLANLEKSLDDKSSEPWCHRRLPTPTATFPAVIDSEEENSDFCYTRPRVNCKKLILKNYEGLGTDCFLQKDLKADQVVSKEVRALRKKLQQIDMLEAKQLNGHHLDDQQVAKLETRSAVENALAELGIPLESESKASLPSLIDGKRNKKSELSRKQRRKNKLMPSLTEVDSVEVSVEHNSTVNLPDVKSLEIPKETKEVGIDINSESRITEGCSLLATKSVSRPHNANNNNKAPQSTSSKKKNKKGGLSMFLSGALDEPRQAPPPPPTPKSEGPAWGGAKITKSLSSLRDIQNEQSKTTEVTNNRLKDRGEDFTCAVSPGQIRLSSFLPKTISTPIPVTPARAVPTTEGEKNTPPWSSAGSSPVMGRPSLRNIQMQQEKKQLSISNSPKTRTSGFSICSQGSPSDSGVAKDTVPNRWFKPETDAPSSIRSIQIEEKAMKDLKRFYSSVKLVKAEPKF